MCVSTRKIKMKKIGKSKEIKKTGLVRKGRNDNNKKNNDKNLKRNFLFIFMPRWCSGQACKPLALATRVRISAGAFFCVMGI